MGGLHTEVRATSSDLQGEGMKVLDQGVNPLFMDPDPDKAREFFRDKTRAMVDKRMTEKEAVERFVPDGCYLAIGGFGANRIPNAIFHEIVRQRRKNLGFLGHTSTHDFQVLCAGKVFNRLDAAYVVGLEARGLSPNARRYMESGEVQVTEWSNYALAARLRAAADGVSFAVTRSMLGTDTFKMSAAKVIECPFTGKKYAAVPALWPDVAAIHVHEADMYGNSVITRHLGGRPRAGPGRQAPDHHHRASGAQLRDPRRPDRHLHPLLPGGRGGRGPLRQLSRQHALPVLLRRGAHLPSG